MVASGDFRATVNGLITMDAPRHEGAFMFRLTGVGSGSNQPEQHVDQGMRVPSASLDSTQVECKSFVRRRAFHEGRWIYLEVFALTVALGLRYLGVLLMGSLIIIPAAAAKRLSNNLNQMLTIAAVGSLLATLAGSALAEWLHRQTGPLIVSVAAAGFMLTLAIPHRSAQASRWLAPSPVSANPPFGRRPELTVAGATREMFRNGVETRTHGRGRTIARAAQVVLSGCLRYWW